MEDKKRLSIIDQIDEEEWYWLSTMDRAKVIAEDNGIDNIDDWYGKYLLLRVLLEDMGDNEANKLMDELLGILEDEIKEYEL